ncbi:response regulator transcription factor [Alicyclobacillus fastidiosus]|uniref:Response regulator transcription factor n=1 Tax=Alicyclobacillus fastidiosus TaxID=392011 RepID=A0ABV5ALF5_9BACL|nr:response regulator transcription factor [Alicyclobacillus fastidiosus]WEH08411.1 response regulator transcription factor [Alicyclobacillus fastidiosus]
MIVQPTVLVVDDDDRILQLMKDFLEHDMFHVEIAHGANEARKLYENADCIILDVMMAEQNGFDFCREIRISSEVPILFLSAHSHDVDKIRGLALGGDDYIVKTATPGEIVARVKAVLRRTGSRQKVAKFGALELNFSTREVSVHGQEVSLSPREYDLLQLFIEHPRQVFTYEHLISKFWNGVGDKGTIRVHINRLREKIETDPNKPKYIVNVWGIGYRFEGK